MFCVVLPSQDVLMLDGTYWCRFLLPPLDADTGTTEVEDCTELVKGGVSGQSSMEWHHNLCNASS